jgi:hypothetical protein
MEPKLVQCPICLRFVGYLVRDHNHETGEVRGEICEPCNAYIGLLESRNPRTVAWRQSKQKWLQWMHGNAGRLYSHMQSHTGVSYKRKIASREPHRGAVNGATLTVAACP